MHLNFNDFATRHFDSMTSIMHANISKKIQRNRGCDVADHFFCSSGVPEWKEMFEVILKNLVLTNELFTKSVML